jgi:hypothetical protein
VRDIQGSDCVREVNPYTVVFETDDCFEVLRAPMFAA